MNQSPLFSVNGPPPQCGMRLVEQFLADPRAPLDVACVPLVVAPAFSRPLDEVRYLFGRDDMWLGAPVASPAIEPPTFAEIRAVHRLPL